MSRGQSLKSRAASWIKNRNSQRLLRNKTRRLLLESLEDRRVLAALWDPTVSYPLPGSFSQNESSGLARLDSNSNAAVASAVIAGTAVDAVSGVSLVESTDLSSSGFGYTLAHSRQFTGVNNTGNNGNGWVVSNQPYLVLYSNETDPVVAYIESGKAPLLFTITGGSNTSGTWDSQLHAAAKLNYNTSTNYWTLLDAQGNRLKFYDLPRADPVGEELVGSLIMEVDTGYAGQTLHGKIVSKKTPGDTLTSYAYYTTGDDVHLLESITRQTISQHEVFRYAYDEVSNEIDGSARLLSSVTLERTTGISSPVDVRSVTYDYYTGEGDDSDHGRLGDLKLVTVHQGDAEGGIIHQEYYRYYKQSGYQPGGSPGATNDPDTTGGTDTSFPIETGDNTVWSGLKLSVSGAAFARMAANYEEFTEATDAQLLPFADQFYKYQRWADSQWSDLSYDNEDFADEYNYYTRYRVVESLSARTGKSSWSDGHGLTGFEIHVNQSATGMGSDEFDPNIWRTRTTVFLPNATNADSNTNGLVDGDQWADNDRYLIYANEMGQVLLTVLAQVDSTVNSVDSVSRSTSVVTITASDHGLTSGDLVAINGTRSTTGWNSNQPALPSYDGVYEVNVTGTDTFEYNISVPTSGSVPTADAGTMNWVKVESWTADYYRYRQQVDTNPNDYIASEYEGFGQLVLHANPSAVSGWREDYPALVGTGLVDVGSFQHIKDEDGLIELHSYYTTTTASETTPGGKEGYRWKSSVKQGEMEGSSTSGIKLLQGGTVIESREYIESEMEEIPTELIIPVYPVASYTLYHESGEIGPQTTSYTYQWHPGTTQPLSISTELPVIVLSQNGPFDDDPYATSNDPGDTTTVKLDEFGWATWTRDGDGYINNIIRDVLTGSVIGTIADYDTGQFLTQGDGGAPEGWETPFDGGMKYVTDINVDLLGRPTRFEDPSGRVTHTIYNELTREVRTYPGWDADTGTTLGPITIQREYWPEAGAPSGERTVYSEVLTASPTIAVSGSSGNYLPTGTETITAGDLHSLSRQVTNDAGQLVADLQYFSFASMTYTQEDAILGTASNDNTTGHYHVTTTQYDGRGRVARVEDPTGTITRNEYEARGLLTQVWIGTSDTPTSGSWSPANTTGADMTLVMENQYDNGQPGGDGNVTQTTQYPGDGADDRVSQMHYDWRNRLVATKAAVGTSESSGDNSHPITYNTYDNLNRLLTAATYDGDTVSIVDSNSDGVPDVPSSSLRRQLLVSEYDNQSRLFRTTNFIVDQSNGNIGSVGLVTAYWFDRRGNVVKKQLPDAPFEKTITDGLGRLVRSYLTDAGGDDDWSDSRNVTGDIVLQQTELTYDGSSNLVVSHVRHRFHDAAETGELESSTGEDTPSRSQFTNMFYDEVNRLVATVNSGTVNIERDEDFELGEEVPASSDTVLVTTQEYDEAGRLFIVTDPRGIESRTYYDALGRTTKTIENYDDGQPSSDDDASVQFTYDGLGQQLSVTVLLPSSVIQETEYIYGASLSRGDGVNDNRSLIATWHPSKSTGQASDSEEETYTVNALGQRTSLTDRNGTTRELSYDLLGRMTGDTASTLGSSGVDGAIRHIGYAFNSKGLLETITSYSDTAGTTVVNQLLREYNDLGQMITEYQSHSGAVNSGTSPKVQYEYSFVSGGANHSRLTQVIYPDGRENNYIYDSGIDNDISRLSSVTDSSSNTLESYAYMGLSTVVTRSRPETDTALDYVKLSGESNGDGGDQYTGLDRFGRIVDQRWLYDGTDDVDRYAYTYDRSSNRLTRDNLVDSALDELYTYDGLNRLTSAERGSMDSRIVGSYIYHKNSSFDSTSVQAALDTGKSLAREESGSVILTYSNLINTSRGLNGLVFDIENLPASSLSTSDFVFQMSPQGVYTQSSNPPEGWTSAPAPSQIEVIAASGGNPPRVIIRWADNDIMNRWLRVTIKSTADTGLFNDEIFYAGHLLGEVTGAVSGVYTVSTTDQSAISPSVGQSATVSSTLDINKDGNVTYADISEITPYRGTQQENITTAINPLADLTRSQVWNLDALGNFSSLENNGGAAESRTHNLQNQVTSVGVADLSFDPNGNTLVDEQSRVLFWDAWNRLVRVEDDNEQTLVEYQYDGLKRRIIEDDGTDERHLYYSDQWQVIEEQISGDTTVQYVWSPVYLDSMILRDRDADANTGNGFESRGLEERIYVLHDANYNVTAITDDSGDVLERYYYEAYGQPVYLDESFDLLADAESQYAWQHLHQGGRLDVITGNYHFRHRDLSPSLGRWISQDPIGFAGGDANLYRYVGNAAIVFVDPFGLSGSAPPFDWGDDGPGVTNNELSAKEFLDRIKKVIITKIRSIPEVKEIEDEAKDFLRDKGRKVGDRLFPFLKDKLKSNEDDSWHPPMLPVGDDPMGPVEDAPMPKPRSLWERMKISFDGSGLIFEW